MTSSGPDKVEVGAAVFVFVVFVLPTIIGVGFMIWQFTKSMVTGKPMPEDPREFYGLKKKTDKEKRDELNRKILDLKRSQEEWEIKCYGKVRERMPDPSDPEFFASYNRHGKEAK